jgi:hypothetical protein
MATDINYQKVQFLLRLRPGEPFRWSSQHLNGKDMKSSSCAFTPHDRQALPYSDHSNPPDMYHGLKLGYQLLFGDGGTYYLRSHLHVELILNFFL